MTLSERGQIGHREALLTGLHSLSQRIGIAVVQKWK
jgi:hypothetical protein